MGELTLPVVIVLAFAAERLAMALGIEKVGEPVRKFLYRKQATWGRTGRWLHNLGTCPWCLSMWFSTLAVVVWIWLVLPAWPGIGVAIFAVLGTAGACRMMVSIEMAVHKYVEP